MLAKPSNRFYLLAALLLAFSVASLVIDMPVARYVSQVGMPGDLRKLFSVSEVFAHGMGVALILIAILVLDPARRRFLPRVVCCTYGAGLVAQLGKNLLPRVRPNVCDLSTTAWQTFFAGGGKQYAAFHQLSGRDIHAYPSGHSATAVGLAFGLAWLYPRGRWLFAAYAVLAIMQRIESGAHFASDTFAGAAVACLVAGVCFDRYGLHPLFTRWERPNSHPEMCPNEPIHESRQAA